MPWKCFTSVFTSVFFRFFYKCEYLEVSQRNFFDEESNDPKQPNQLMNNLKKRNLMKRYCHILLES